MLLLDTLRLLDFGILITVLHESLKIGWGKGLERSQKGNNIVYKFTPYLIEDPMVIDFQWNSSPYAYSTPYGN